MSVTTAQLTDKNSSPNAIKICKKKKKAVTMYAALTFFIVKMKAGLLTMLIYLRVIVHTHLLIN